MTTTQPRSKLFTLAVIAAVLLAGLIPPAAVSLAAPAPQDGTLAQPLSGAEAQPLQQDGPEPPIPGVLTQGPPPPAADLVRPPEPELYNAVAEALSAKGALPGFPGAGWKVDHALYGPKGDVALVFLAPVDIQTGQVIPTEPVMAVGRKSDTVSKALTGGWTVTVPSADELTEAVASLPADLQPYAADGGLGGAPAFQDELTPEGDVVPKAVGAVTALGGYKLPWAQGLVKYVSQTIGHSTCTGGTCSYAFDFYGIGSAPEDDMFGLLAAKGGTIFSWKDTCANGNEWCTNNIILRDGSTTPVTYQIYIHLAQNSIPTELKQVGKPVNQGDYIGRVDDTGYSTGHHLHYMVVSEGSLYFSNTRGGYYWGTSQDITFRDVDINWDPATQGGRPRLPWEADAYGGQGRYDYASGNVGTHPPTGELTYPADRQEVANSIFVAGTAQDDRQVTKIQMIANWDGSWRDVGPAQIASPFAFNLDVCAAGIPAGPFELALAVYDMEGNTSGPVGVRHLVRTGACAPPPLPSCSPAADQVAFFTEPDFGGACRVLPKGSYPTMAGLFPLTDNNIASVKIGASVQAVLYDGANYTGRSETFTTVPDRTLTDNPIGFRTTGSIKVLVRDVAPMAPVIAAPHGVAGATAPTSADSLVLSWLGDGATKYQAQLFSGANPSLCGGAGAVSSLAFRSVNTWSVGNLAPGDYTLCVQGRIGLTTGATLAGPWSARTFNVQPGSLAAGSAGFPYAEDFETGGPGWTSTGLWRVTWDPGDVSNYVYGFGIDGQGYDTGAPASGDLTSPPIAIPGGSKAYLSFSSRYQTETSSAHWDQRLVQVSVDGGPFREVSFNADLQDSAITNWVLQGESMKAWVPYTGIDLSAYAGKTVRVRFHFDSVDAVDNSGWEGWMVDNVTLTTTAPAACAADSDTPAAPLSSGYGLSKSGIICPGDVDYYKFTGYAGDVVIIDVDAKSLSNGSDLDAFVALARVGDTASLIASNDDEVPGASNDSYLIYKLRETGDYEVQVRDFYYPAGGPNHRYTLKLAKGSASNQPGTQPLRLTYPASGQFFDGALATISAEISPYPAGSATSHVDFYWHNADWVGGTWRHFATDWNGSDGWTAFFPPSVIPEGAYVAIMARSVDVNGGSSAAVNWQVRRDGTPPWASFAGVPASQDETAVLLRWDAGDAEGALGSFILFSSTDGADWQPWTEVSGGLRRAFFVGQRGHSYRFRMHPVDLAGNIGAATETGAVTITGGPCQPDAFESGDNTSGGAAAASVGAFQAHNFCDLGDVDWVRFQAAAGQGFLLRALPTAESAAAPWMTLYVDPGGAPLLQFRADELGQPADLYWEAPYTGTYYLKVQSARAEVAGTGVLYQLYVGPGTRLYMPSVSK